MPLLHDDESCSKKHARKKIDEGTQKETGTFSESHTNCAPRLKYAREGGRERERERERKSRSPQEKSVLLGRTFGTGVLIDLWQ